MRLHISGILLVVLLPIMAFSQSGDLDRHAIAAKVLGIDYGTPNDADLDYTFGLEVAYRYLLTPNIGFAVPLKIGVADVVGDVQNRNITSFDALLHLYPFGGDQKIKPYALGGIGYVIENIDGGNTQIPIGLGFNYMIGPNSYLSLQGEYRMSSEDLRDNYQLGVGYLYQFGKEDADGDGIVDGEDACPEEFGLQELQGCPDADGDGIPNSADVCPTEPGPAISSGCPDADEDGVVDSEDACPELAGPADLQGCPDQDGDGVPDLNDSCPTIAGDVAMKGCPDTDGDSLHDGIDECPEVAGLVSNKGCPGADRDGDGVLDDDDACPDKMGTVATKGCPDTDGDGVRDSKDLCPEKAGTFDGCPDTDGDGVHDGDDRCPEVVGLEKNKGCPEIEEEVKEVLNLAMRAVQFETGSDRLKSESHTILDQIASIMTRYPAYQLRIVGHTDNVGDASRNQELSESRAASCYEYLLSKGTKASRMTFAGFGEDYPIAPNTSSSGRTLNRRVEFDLIVQ